MTDLTDLFYKYCYKNQFTSLRLIMYNNFTLSIHRSCGCSDKNRNIARMILLNPQLRYFFFYPLDFFVAFVLFILYNIFFLDAFLAGAFGALVLFLFLLGVLFIIQWGARVFRYIYLQSFRLLKFAGIAITR